jgi:acyl carrier protein
MSTTTQDREEVIQFLSAAIEDLVDVDPDDLRPDMVLEELGLISLDYVEIHVLTKRRYGVELSLELFVSGQVTTLGELADYVAGHSAASGAEAAAGESRP